MALTRSEPVISKIVVDNRIYEHANRFSFLRCILSYLEEIGLRHILTRFNRTNETIMKTLESKVMVMKCTMIKYDKTTSESLTAYMLAKIEHLRKMKNNANKFWK